MIGWRTPCLSWWNLMLHPQGILRSRFFWPVIIGDIIGRSSLLTKVLLVGKLTMLVNQISFGMCHEKGGIHMVVGDAVWLAHLGSDVIPAPWRAWSGDWLDGSPKLRCPKNDKLLASTWPFQPPANVKVFGVIIPSRMEHPTCFKRPTSQNLRSPEPEKNCGSPRESLVAWFILVLIRHLPYYWSPIPFLNDY